MTEIQRFSPQATDVIAQITTKLSEIIELQK